jgi:hypothetical protein
LRFLCYSLAIFRISKDTKAMNRLPLVALIGTLILAATPANASPRDADAVLARCGRPLKGDQTILESTVAGGRRLLMYERGTLNFEKVGTEGWTFTHGTHQKLDHLTAEEMEKYMPCLKEALATAATGAPIKKMPAVQRMERAADVEHPYKMLSAYLGGVAILFAAFFVWMSRKPETIED